MKKKILAILSISSFVCSIVLIYFELKTYYIVTLTLSVVLLVSLIIELKGSKTPEDIYQKELNELIKTYEPILVDVDKLPEIDTNKIISVSSFEKLVDVQYELKKPIIYLKEEKACNFILIDSEVTYIYVLKETEEIISTLDKFVEELENDSEKIKNQKKVLEDIEKTTIIKLDDMKEYIVKPVRKKEIKEIEVKKPLTDHIGFKYMVLYSKEIDRHEIAKHYGVSYSSVKKTLKEIAKEYNVDKVDNCIEDFMREYSDSPEYTNIYKSYRTQK